MIAVRLMGGLGNQLFQYATARRLALKRGLKLMLDLASYERPERLRTPRQYELFQFVLSPDVSISSSAAPLATRDEIWITQPWHVYGEQQYNFDPKVIDLPAMSYLSGFWQTERYFCDVRRELELRPSGCDPIVGGLASLTVV